METTKPTVNEATGEVTFKLEGHEFKIRASLGGLADFQAALGVPGLTAMQELVGLVDARAIYHGPRCLMTHGDPAVLARLMAIPNFPTITEALTLAITHGLPDLQPDKRGNGDATSAQPMN